MPMVTRKNTKRAQPSKMRSTPLIILGGGLLILLLIFGSFFSKTPKVENEPYIMGLEQRLAAIEQHLASTGMGEQAGEEGGLSNQVERLNTSWQRLDASLTLKTKLLAERLDKLEARLEDIKKKLEAQPVALSEKTTLKPKPKLKRKVKKRRLLSQNHLPNIILSKKGIRHTASAKPTAFLCRS